MAYKYTGAQIPVDVNDIYIKVGNELTNYDMNSDEYDYSPYTDPIIYATPEGKTIVVPDNIQQDIINKHNMQKNNKSVQKKDDKSQDSGSSVKKIMIMIGIIFIIYLAYNELKNKTK